VIGGTTIDAAVETERARGAVARPRPLVLFTRDDPRASIGGVETFTQRLLAAFPGSEIGRASCRERVSSPV